MPVLRGPSTAALMLRLLLQPPPPLPCSDVEEGGTTDFPRSGGYPASRALEACLAGSNNHPAAPPSSPASVVAWGQQEEEEGRDEGGGVVDAERASGKVALPPAGASSPPGLKVVPKQGRVIVFW